MLQKYSLMDFPVNLPETVKVSQFPLHEREKSIPDRFEPAPGFYFDTVLGTGLSYRLYYTGNYSITWLSFEGTLSLVSIGIKIVRVE
jgi:hypothetical protein